MLASLLLIAAVGVDEPAARAAIEEENLAQLLHVRRIFVDRLTGGDTAAQMRDMILSSLQGTGKFLITENPERADAVLRGSAEDLIYTDVHATSDSLNVRGNIGVRETSTRRVIGTRDDRGYNAGFGAGESESSRIAERRHEAVAAVRLVNKDGDLIWATTQESTGGKFRGSSADVADKITRKLLEDYARAQRLKK